MDEKIFLRDRKLVPPKVEYHSRQRVVISWMNDSSWEIGNLSLRAAEHVSLSPSYSIVCAFYLNLTKKGW